MMQGTPYIYQGEEFGMTDPKFSSIDDYRDVETLNLYDTKKQEGFSDEEILRVIQAKSRDNSRTPVQWNDSRHGGFTEGTPWIPVANNYQTINAEASMKDENSVFYHYKKLIQLRKNLEIITYGDYKLLLEDDEKLFVYERNYEDEKLLVINHFYDEEVIFRLPADIDVNDYRSELLISNYSNRGDLQKSMMIRPYESLVYHLKKA